MKTDNLDHEEKVSVLGSGQLGVAVLDALVSAVIRRQGTVSVIVSSTARDEVGQLRSANHQAPADAGATLLAVDIAGSAMETLADQFRGFTTVINCMGLVAGLGTQLKITHAVLAAGVPRYLPWQFGVNYDVVGKGSDQPVWDEQYDVRTLLRAQRATKWVIVSTGMLTSFLLEPDSDVVNLSNRISHALGSWDTQVTITLPVDIGRLTTAIYLHQPRIVNEVVLAAGETTSYRQLADTVERVAQQTFSKAVHTLSALLEQLRTNPDDAILRYRAAFARGDGVWRPMGDTWNARHQLPTQNIAGWLRTAR